MTTKTNKPATTQQFGAHMSIAGGLENAFGHALAADCDCLQIFVKNQRQWAAKPMTDDQIRLYRDAERASNVTPVVAHATYLLNLASPSEDARLKSVRALVDELTRCEALGVGGLVLHPGAHMGAGLDAGIAAIVHSLNELHAVAAGFKSRILLECTAGQGSAIGHELVHLGRILADVHAPERVGVCLDTCHLFAAGYDLRDADDYERMIGELTKHVGLDRVACIHVNDSKGVCGSRIDRHDHIGKGRIGKAGFARLLNDRRLAHAPRILETPKGVDSRGADLDRLNLKTLRALIKPK